MIFLICAGGVSLAVTLTVSVALSVAIGLVLAEAIYFKKRFRDLKFSFGKQSPRLWSPKDRFDPKKTSRPSEKIRIRTLLFWLSPIFRCGSRFV